MDVGFLVCFVFSFLVTLWSNYSFSLLITETFCSKKRKPDSDKCRGCKKEISGHRAEESPAIKSTELHRAEL